jgi:MFS family permease
VLVALYALDLGARPVTVGVLGATFSILPVMLAVTTGRLADRFGALWLLLLGAGASSVAMAIPYTFPGLTPVFIAAALSGLSLVMYNVSTQNLVGLMSIPADRARNFSNYSLVSATTNFVGPLLAGYSIEHAGFAPTFLYLVLLCALPLPMLMIWRRAVHVKIKSAPQGHIRFTEMLKSPGIPGTLASSSLQDTGDILYQFYMPVYTHAIGLPPSAIGVVLAMKSAAGFVMRVSLPKLLSRLSERRLLQLAFCVGTAAVIFVPFFKSPVVLSVLSFIFGLGVGCAGPIITMLMFANSPPGRSGEALGTRTTVNHFTKLVTPLIFGAIASGLGVAMVFWTNAALLGAGAMLNRSKPGRPREAATRAVSNDRAA